MALATSVKSFILRAALAAAFLTLGAVPATAQPGSPACRVDLEANDKRFEQTLEKLEAVKNAMQAEKCVAYRAHVKIMEQGREVFARCNTGTTLRENVGQMSDSIADFMELIRRRCTR
jgi:hypothetical protein